MKHVDYLDKPNLNQINHYLIVVVSERTIVVWKIYTKEVQYHSYAQVELRNKKLLKHHFWSHYPLLKKKGSSIVNWQLHPNIIFNSVTVLNLSSHIFKPVLSVSRNSQLI